MVRKKKENQAVEAIEVTEQEPADTLKNQFNALLDSAPKFPVFSEKDDVNRVIQVRFMPAYNQFLIKLERFKKCLS